MEIVSSTVAKATLNALIAQVVEDGKEFLITSHGKPAAVLTRLVPTRKWGMYPGIDLTHIDEPMTEEELALWGESDD